LVGAALRRAFLAAGRRLATFFLAFFGAALRVALALGFRVALRAGFFAAFDFAAFFLLIAI
jgi:hypothetical protein